MGVVTASMGGNLAAGDQQAQTIPLTIDISETKAPSPDNVLAMASPADANTEPSA